ncbi:hypothetical protein F5984_12115 [Rudanella paleaurantiibacter]|uniref:Uncharacterized protein n=1 Tax=Rudanella paleaurantiibacter TaxID=2614655 RepID=A0A7J5TZK5_9BACT|nr:hypothetical protein [Rudanella paleaurantiibacter]KAB7730880.1 hypothetical protein F5984_12115 [Rudanella paleaurantiibacter]
MRKTFFALLLLLTGCDRLENFLAESKHDTIEVRIENQTGGPLTDVRVYTVQSVKVGTAYQPTRTDSVRFGDILPLTTQTGVFSEKNLRSSDGDMEIIATGSTGKRYRQRFGYFTNGHFLTATMQVQVQKDTIRFK